MKFLLQTLFILLTSFTNLVNAIPVFKKVVLLNYKLLFSKIENVKEESSIKIGNQTYTNKTVEIINDNGVLKCRVVNVVGSVFKVGDNVAGKIIQKVLLALMLRSRLLEEKWLDTLKMRLQS